MKPSRFLPFLVVLSVIGLPGGVLRAVEGLQVGTAHVETTPDVFPVRLRSGVSHLVHDPLHARGVAFRSGDGKAVIVLVDAIGLSREELDEVKRKAAGITGWKPEQMLIAATHSHSTPKAGLDDPGSVAYRKKRFEGMVGAITGAVASLEPAKVGFGSADEPTEVYNRRWFMKPGTMPPNPFGEMDKVKMNPRRQDILKPAAPTDPQLCVIEVRTRRGKPLALIANYSLHYVGGIPKRKADGKEMGMASADYFGEFSRIMPYRIGGSNPPENFVAMMTNGTSGDINNIDFSMTRPPRAPFEQVRVVANKAADAAWRATKDLEYDESPVVAMRQREITLQYRSVTEAEVTQARAIMAGIKEMGEEAYPKKALQYARSTLKFQEAGRTEKVLVQAIRIGDQAIVTFPFEVLVEIGLEIKEKSPFERTFTIELANGSYGYLPAPKQHKLGGYETWLGTSRFVPESSEILTKNLLEMLGELHSPGND